MLKGVVFVTNESYRLCKKNLNNTLLLFFYGSLIIYFISLIIAVIFNMSYLLEVFQTRNIPEVLLDFLIPVIANINSLRIVHYLLLGFFMTLLIYVNYSYLKFCFDSYQEEARLVIKLGGDRRLIIRPVSQIILSINFISVITAWIMLRGTYNIFYRTAVRRYLHISLLQFGHFKISLLLILFILVSGAVIPLLYLFFWRRFHKG